MFNSGPSDIEIVFQIVKPILRWYSHASKTNLCYFDNNQIVQTLERNGYSSTQIFDALNQADLVSGAPMPQPEAPLTKLSSYVY